MIRGGISWLRVVSAGESWWHHNAGSVVVAVAAICAAGLAAYVAMHNQSRQLEHDRSLRNQDQLRRSIDAAVESANDAVIFLVGFASNVQTTEVWRTESAAILGDKSSSSDEVREAHEAEAGWMSNLVAEREQCHPKLQGMRATNVQLELRFGSEHPIVVTHEETRASLFSVLYDFSPGVLVSRAAEASASDDDRIDASGSAFARFRDSCRTWFVAQSA